MDKYVPTPGLNVLCSGGIHPVTRRPCHPIHAAKGVLGLKDWIEQVVGPFGARAPILIRTPGGWIPYDGPLQRYDQLVLGWRDIYMWLTEMYEWKTLVNYFKARGHQVYVHLGAPRTASSMFYMLKPNYPETSIVYDATASSDNLMDIENIEVGDAVEGWPRPGTQWAFDPGRKVFLQHNNARTILTRTPENWDNVAHVPLDEFAYTEDQPHHRLNIFAEGSDEDTAGTKAFLLLQASRGSQIFYNPDKQGNKWGISPQEFWETARSIR